MPPPPIPPEAATMRPREANSICAMVKSRVFLGMGDLPPLNDGILIMGLPYYWVDDHPLLYGNNGSLDPGTSEFEKKKGLPSWMSR